jgi:hypothetical protein
MAMLIRWRVEVVMKSFWVAGVLALASCGDAAQQSDAAVPDAMPDAPPPPPVEVARIPVTPNPDLDVLFVIDDSPSTLDKQTNLKNAFPAFITELSLVEGGLPNLHIGVLTPDLGTQGAADASPGPGIGSGPGSCAENGKQGNLQTNGTQNLTGVFISDTKGTGGTRVTNYTGSLATVFSDIASVGTAGCGFEQPLQAAKNALDNNATNAGFLRANANLAIVIVTDEDDCSMSHSTLLGPNSAVLGPLGSFRCTRYGVQCNVGGATSDAMSAVGVKGECSSNEMSPYLTRVEDYATFFAALKSDPHMVLFAGIIGDPTPVEVELRAPPGGGIEVPTLVHSCTYNGANGPEVGDPGVRIAHLASKLPLSYLSSVCTQSLQTPMTEIARRVRGLVGDTCLTRDIAIPADCNVREEISTSSTPLPACDNGASSTNKPCYELVADATKCTTASHLRLVVQRAAIPAPNSVIIAECRI